MVSHFTEGENGTNPGFSHLGPGNYHQEAISIRKAIEEEKKLGKERIMNNEN